MDTFKESRLLFPTTNTLSVQMVGKMEKFAVMTGNASQTGAIDIFVRNYLIHVHFATKIVIVPQVVATSFIALAWI